LTGWRKTRGNWVVEIGGQLPRIEVAGNICLGRARPTQGCRANDDDDDDDDKIFHLLKYSVLWVLLHSSSSSSVRPVANATDLLQRSRLIVLTLSPPPTV